jgi:hypothetical protein
MRFIYADAHLKAPVWAWSAKLWKQGRFIPGIGAIDCAPEWKRIKGGCHFEGFHIFGHRRFVRHNALG